MARLGLSPHLTFISCLGDDEKGDIIKKSMHRVKIDVSGIYLKKGERSAAFNGMLNGKGEFLVGIADMDILASIPQSHLDLHKFQKAQILMIDSNIGNETLTYVLNNSQHVEHVIYEPISKEKSSRILHQDSLPRITMLKPNLIQMRDLAALLNPEAFSSFNVEEFPQNKEVVERMIEELFNYAEKIAQIHHIQNRLTTIVVTLGKCGVLVGGNSTISHYEAIEVDEKLYKSSVGCGDSFMGGYIFGLYHRKSVDECVEYGQKCAVKSLMSERNVSDEIVAGILM